MTYTEANKQIKAAKLLLEYYQYFGNMSNVKAYAQVSYEWDAVARKSNHYPEIWIRKYVQKTRIKNGQRLNTLIEFCPDMVCEKKEHNYYNVYRIVSIDLSLPSIKTNDLGFERNVE